MSLDAALTQEHARVYTQHANTNILTIRPMLLTIILMHTTRIVALQEWTVQLVVVPVVAHVPLLIKPVSINTTTLVRTPLIIIQGH